MTKVLAASMGVATSAVPKDLAASISMKAAYATSAYALANALVRVLIGAIADKTGTRICFLITFTLQVIAMGVLFPVEKSYSSSS